MQSNKKSKGPIIDLIYSFTAYILPTFVIQFLIFPLIARRLTPENNGLFLALFNAVRLCVSLFIIPLSSIRLLKKKECIDESKFEKGFNFLFLTVTAISLVIVIVLGLFYYKWVFDLYAMIRLIAVLILLATHDYFAIAFRIIIDYKKLLIDNLMIVLGYAVGIFLMLQFGYWELIFISGYVFGLVYTLTKSNMWRAGVQRFIKKETIKEYCQLSISSGLNTSTTYCDKMLIYPLIGGLSVSIYNAAAAVSKMMALVSVPLRNVFLSYIVDTDKVSISSSKRKKVTYLFIGLSIIIYGAFYFASIILCKILYPQYYAKALEFIPIILLAVLLETYAGLLKVYLLRFEKTLLQTITSLTKVSLYLICVLIFNVVFQFGLIGFCLSILISECVHFLMVLIFFIKSIMKQKTE